MRFDDLAAEVLRRPARLGPVRLIAVDGPSGSGKSTFAGRLAAALERRGARVAVVHTDDLLDGWDDMLTFWPRLVARVLEPARRGGAGRFRRYDWQVGRFGPEEVTVPAADVLVLDGVSTARAGVAEDLTLSVMVTADRGLRRQRAIGRDGEQIRQPLAAWALAEDRHFAADRTRERADLVVDGSAGNGDSFVLLGPPGTAVAGRAHSIAAMTDAMTDAELREAIAREMPGVRADLERLVRIPGIAFDGFDHAEVQRSAEAVAELLRGAGLPDVRIVRHGSGQPAVIGRRPAPEGAPTVLLYAHHDVQPIGDRSQWLTEPFEPTERDGRLYARGAADDKAGVMAHVAALRAFGDQLPVGVVLFIEGEEEFGSESLEDLLREYRDDIAADVIVIADSGNWDVGEPALTTSLRGLVNLFVDVRTLDHAVHSGMFGGPIPDALVTMSRLLATLHDDNGDVAVEGLVRKEATPLDYPEERFRAESGILDGVDLIGTGRIVDRVWTRPSLSVLGIDAPPTVGAPNALVPAARAKISVRIAPGDDPKSAFKAVAEHLRGHAPWGAQVTVTLEQDGAPCVIDATGPMYEAARQAFATAWDGTAPVDIGVGGSIPFIATFQEMFPDAAVLVTGVEDPDARAHGPNESLHLGEFARVCLAEALLLRNVAAAR
jgi:acetylornithine deacetylase/succinyl-diaminopimelate desuccinylase-like protein/uridine kinase